MASTPSLANIVAAVHADPILLNYIPPGSATPQAFAGLIGESSRAAKASPPYVVWIPTRDRFEVIAGQKTATGPAFPRLIRTRWMGVELHINCPAGAGPTDFDQVDVALNAVIAAIHRTLRGSYQLGGGELKDTKGTELTKDRKVYLLNAEFAVPITEMSATAVLATITTITDPLSLKYATGREYPPGGPAFPPP